MQHRHKASRHAQTGATAVELALVLGVLMTLLLGVVDLARWQAAAASLHEAARVGARVAAVCDPQDTQAGTRAMQRLVSLSAYQSLPTVVVAVEPAGCSRSSCQRVRVTLEGARLQALAPLWPGGLPLPTAQVELPRESMSSQLNGRNNPECL